MRHSRTRRRRSRGDLLVDGERRHSKIRPRISAEQMVLIAHSWGAKIAAVYLADQSDRVASLVLLSPDAVPGSAAPVAIMNPPAFKLNPEWEERSRWTGKRRAVPGYAVPEMPFSWQAR
jgi:pimeloyl-ACP methyl ester carboxylesterase